DGMPQKVEFTAGAGDPIGGEATMKDSRGVERTLRLETNAVVVDVFNESLGARGNTGAALLLDGDTQVMNLRRVDRDSESDALIYLKHEAGVRATTMPVTATEGRDVRSPVRPAPFPGSPVR